MCFVGGSAASAQTVAPIAAPPSQPGVTAPLSPLPGFSKVFTSTVGDFKRLPSKETATWLSLGAALALAAHAQDREVTRAFNGNGLHETFEAGATIGGVPLQLGGAFAAYSIGRVVKSPALTSAAVDLVRAQVLSQAVTHAVKFSVRRVRPDGTAYSFPSGHTSSSFATATVLQRHFGWKAGVPAYALATYVAASRVESRRHFLSDVTFGAAIGIVAGRSVTVGRGDAKFAVSPIAAPGGGGIGFTWVGGK
jgi:membrane-associated phospholipid phosphatase